jgi:hypothetical protein
MVSTRRTIVCAVKIYGNGDLTYKTVLRFCCSVTLPNVAPVEVNGVLNLKATTNKSTKQNQHQTTNISIQIIQKLTNQRIGELLFLHVFT